MLHSVSRVVIGKSQTCLLQPTSPVRGSGKFSSDERPNAPQIGAPGSRHRAALWLWQGSGCRAKSTGPKRLLWEHPAVIKQKEAKGGLQQFTRTRSQHAAIFKRSYLDPESM